MSRPLMHDTDTEMGRVKAPVFAQAQVLNPRPSSSTQAPQLTQSGGTDLVMRVLRPAVFTGHQYRNATE